MNLDIDNIDEVANQFQSEKMFGNQSNFYNLTINLQEAVLRRPSKISLYADLLTKMNAIAFAQYFVTYMFGQLAEKYVITISTFIPAFILRLCQRQLYSFQELVKQISDFFELKTQCLKSIEWMYCWFAPEIQQYDEPLFDRMTSFLKLRSSSQEISNFYQQVNSQAQYRENEWHLLKQKRSIEYASDPLANIIVQDDVKSLREISSNPDFDPDFQIPMSVFETFWLFLKGPTLILVAAFSGAVQCFNFLISLGASLTKEDRTSRNIQQYALAGGNTEIIRYLQTRGFTFGQALPIATSFHQNSIFEWIYDTECPNLFENIDRRGSVFTQSWNSNNLRIFLFCLSKGANISLSDGTGNTMLHYCAIRGYNQLLDFALEQNIFSVNSPGTFDKTALHFACESGNVYAVKRLLSFQDINVNLQDSEGNTPILCAIIYGSFEIIDILLSRSDIDLTITNSRGDTALHFAALQGNVEIANAILARCPTLINCQNRAGQTPFYNAASNSNFQVSKAFYDAGADPEIKSSRGVFPLFAAIVREKYQTVELLLRSSKVRPQSKAQGFEVAKKAGISQMVDFIRTILISMKLNYPPLYSK